MYYTWKNECNEYDGPPIDNTYEPIEGNGATLYIPSLKKASITVYDANNYKCLEAIVAGGEFTTLHLYKREKAVLEIDGEFKCEYFEAEPMSYHLTRGSMRIYSDTKEDYFLKKEITISENSKNKSIKSENAYYSSGNLYYNKQWETRVDDPSFYELISQVYYNEDGSEMSLSDRLFHEKKDYVVLKSDFCEYNGERCYMVLMPSHGNSIGEGAFILSSRQNLTKFTIDRMFEYRLNDDILDTFNYSYLGVFGKYRDQRINSKIYKIIDDGDFGVSLSGPHYYWRKNKRDFLIKMNVYDMPYNEWFKETIQESLNRQIYHTIY